MFLPFEEKCEEEEDEYISTEVGMEVEDPSSEVMETDGLESSFEREKRGNVRKMMNIYQLKWV